MEKKTSIHIEEKIWEMVEKLSTDNQWPHKLIISLALYHFCNLPDSEQLEVYKQHRGFIKGLRTKE